MPLQTLSSPSYFLTLRLWSEEMGDEAPAWRGRIQNVANGEVSYFQGWDALVEALYELIVESKEQTSESD